MREHVTIPFNTSAQVTFTRETYLSTILLWIPSAGLGLPELHRSHKSHIVGHMWLFMYVLTYYYKKNTQDKCSHDAIFVGKPLTDHGTRVCAVSAAHV